jgi:hypothetical protein
LPGYKDKVWRVEGGVDRSLCSIFSEISRA